MGVQSAQIVVHRSEVLEQLLFGRVEKHVATGLPKLFQVMRQLARIVGQVFFVVELQGVDEYAGRDRATIDLCSVYQAHMSFMQGPHGGNEPYRSSLVALVGRPFGCGAWN